MRVLFSLILAAFVAVMPSLGNAQKKAPTAKKHDALKCAEVTIVLPFAPREMMTRTIFELDMVVEKKRRALSWSLPQPREVAECNKLPHFARDPANPRKGAGYIEGTLYLDENMAVGLHGKHAVLLDTKPFADFKTDSVYVKMRLPVGKPIYIGYPVCDSRDWSFSYYMLIWNGMQSETVRFPAAVERQENAYREAGKCQYFRKKWLSTWG